MTGNNKSGPRKIHIGPAATSRENNRTNVVHLPTEVIDHKSQDTWISDRVVEKPPTRDRVRAVVSKCQTALVRSKTKADVEETPQRDDQLRHTFSADLAKHRQIREKCTTIREVTITILTVCVCVNIFIVMIWLQLLLNSWRN